MAHAGSGGPSPIAHALQVLRAGRVDEATTLLDALDVVPLPGTERAGLLAARADVLVGRGDLAAAAALVGPLTRLLGRPGPDGRATGAVAHHALGDLAAAAGHLEAAVEHQARVGSLAPDADPEQLPWRAHQAVALVRARRGHEADQQARAHLRLARAAGSAYGIAVGLRTVATVTRAGEGLHLLEEAREVLADVEAARLAAQVDTDLAGLLVLAGEGPSPRVLALLRGASTYAAAEGLWPLQQRARRLLDLVGAAPSGAAEALAGLTVAERRVTVLAAQGLSNREIATALVVTVKAVEWHLSRVYRKVGVRSRRELPGLLTG
ncbi:transcriptional regulator NarL [Nocardioides dokdonensis FR1436]|uniref:Transcriptional regulator NarL n=1 Tax=Nocardioides dokdonensis FR1436 TaxID=1300347 RepID=A0A1A9GJE8_9ACTN|nr:LuxR C-terminal-related transcriptional regulator [Nocardioides dokdonensis]ANH37595.1 transcriptional regulator NarL [Nocardioides dokdonensis FR1436]